MISARLLKLSDFISRTHFQLIYTKLWFCGVKRAEVKGETAPNSNSSGFTFDFRFQRQNLNGVSVAPLSSGGGGHNKRKSSRSSMHEQHLPLLTDN